VPDVKFANPTTPGIMLSIGITDDGKTIDGGQISEKPSYFGTGVFSMK